MRGIPCKKMLQMFYIQLALKILYVIIFIFKDSSPKSNCTKDSDCPRGYWSHTSHGISSGLCNQTTHTCQIKAWCPIGSDKLPRNGKKPLLEDIQNFTLMLKNVVEFPGCGHKMGRLIKSDVTKEYIRNCTWNPKTEPNCPVFKIGEVVKYVGDEFDDVGIRVLVIHGKLLNWRVGRK